MPRCAWCDAALETGRGLGRRDVCPACGRDLHCCLQCAFYDPRVHHECREPQAEYVREKDVANFCDYFALHGSRREGLGGAVSKASVKDALDALFKKT